MISLENVGKSYGAVTALRPTTLEFVSGQTTVLLGPSGCGKSTLLRLILGLIAPDSGSVAIDGDLMNRRSAMHLRRRMGYVVQDGGLFPHLSAGDNMALVARYLKTPEPQIAERRRELCAMTRLDIDALARYPSELSGGQRQRVGLMRALMLDPPNLLLDEPLGALDPITRRELQDELHAIFDRLGKTVVMVTHDVAEALFFAGTIVLMRDGDVVQAGSEQDLCSQPADPYVTQFLHAPRAIEQEGAA